MVHVPVQLISSPLKLEGDPDIKLLSANQFVPPSEDFQRPPSVECASDQSAVAAIREKSKLEAILVHRLTPASTSSFHSLPESLEYQMPPAEIAAANLSP